MCAKANACNKILDAAETLTVESGVPNLTLDAVATRAGVSKGGLLYHFPSKETLLMAMIQRIHEALQAEHAALASGLAPSSGRALKALVLMKGQCRKHEICKVFSSFLASGTSDPAVLEVLRAHRREKIKNLSAGMRAEFAAIIFLAVDGLWLSEMLETSCLPIGERQKIVDELLRLIDEEEKRESARKPRKATCKNREKTLQKRRI